MPKEGVGMLGSRNDSVKQIQTPLEWNLGKSERNQESPLESLKNLFESPSHFSPTKTKVLDIKIKKQEIK